jgi:hypothetical protein
MLSFRLSTLMATLAMLVLGTVFWFALIPKEIRESDRARAERIKAADDAAGVIATFGPATRDTVRDGADGEATRLLDYPRLRIVFARRPSSSAGAAPIWKIVGFIDPDSGESVPGTEALKRLQAKR